ncbi:MAG: DUF349 domain-containing protein [Pseudomonadota bacterium]
MASLKELIFKPKWQHKNGEVRARSVALDTDPRLVAALPEIARTDPEAEVRLAAVRRLDDLLPLMRVAADDDAEAVRETATRIYRSMLSGEHERSPAIAERLEIVPRLEDTGLIEYLASHGREAEIRAAAIAGIDRPGTLARLAEAESDRDLRLKIIERVDQEATLERLAERFRTSDKRAHKACLKRAHEIGGRVEEDQEADAEALCLAVEALSRSGDPRDEKAERLQELDERWQALPEDVRTPYATRHDGARRIIAHLLTGETSGGKAAAEARALHLEIEGAIADADRLTERSPLGTIQGVEDRLASLAKAASTEDPDTAGDLAAARDRLATLHRTVLEQQPIDGRLARLSEEADRLDQRRVDAARLAKLQERWDQAWSARKPTLHDEGLRRRFEERLAALESAVASQDARREEALERVDSRMEKLESELEEGHLATAVKAKQAVLDDLALIGKHPKIDDVAFKGRVAAARGRLREIRDWQHWANNKVRTNLCEEAEALPAAGLHPDALTARLKELRAQWKELADGERLPGDPANRMPAPGLYRRFQAACNEAFEPAKGFFEKRAEVREQHLDELRGLAERIEAAAAAEIEDALAAERLVRDGRRSMRQLNEIPPKHRSKMARRLREAANALDKRLDDVFAVVERRKQRIIDEVSGLDPENNLEEAINGAKDAQRRWKDAGHLRRNREQALWKAFRAECDRIFGRLKERDAAEKAEADARLDELDKIIEAAVACAEQATADPDAAESTLQRLRGDWRAVGASHRGKERQFEQQASAVEAAIRAARNERRKQGRRDLLQLVDRCLAAEARWFDGDAGTPLPETDLPETMPTDLAGRWERAKGDAPDDLEALAAAAETEAGALCIAFEFLAGVDSPAEAQQARMDYQVARLSDHMSGTERAPRETEIDSLLARWAACGPLAPGAAASAHERLDRALQAL